MSPPTSPWTAARQGKVLAHTHTHTSTVKLFLQHEQESLNVQILLMECGVLSQPLSTCAGDVSVGIKCDADMISEKEEDLDFDIIPNANDTITVKYVPPAAGRLTIKVLFTDQVGDSLKGSRTFWKGMFVPTVVGVIQWAV